jgi:hypothetical protein
VIGLGIDQGVGSPEHWAQLECWRVEVGDQLLGGYATLIYVPRTSRIEETA